MRNLKFYGDGIFPYVLKIFYELFHPIVNVVACCVTDTGACTLPVGTLAVKKSVTPLYASLSATAVKTVGSLTVAAHVKTLLLTAHLPLLEVRVKPLPKTPISIKEGLYCSGMFYLMQWPYRLHRYR